MQSGPPAACLKVAEVAETTPTARVVRSRAALAEAVATWPGSRIDTTWALVAVGEVPSAPDLTALRKAAKTCDRVAALVLPKTPTEPTRVMPTLPEVLRAAGCDMVWVPNPDKALLQIETPQGDTNPRLMLQALLAVLPSVVVVGRADAPKVRLWRLLQTEFGEVLDLVITS